MSRVVMVLGALLYLALTAACWLGVDTLDSASYQRLMGGAVLAAFASFAGGLGWLYEDEKPGKTH